MMRLVLSMIPFSKWHDALGPELKLIPTENITTTSNRIRDALKTQYPEDLWRLI